MFSHSPSSPVLCQSKGVIVDLLAQATDIVSYLVLYLGQLLLSFLRHLNNIELGVYVTCNIRWVVRNER